MQQDKLSCGKCFPNMINFWITSMTFKQPYKPNSVLKKVTSENIENLQEAINLQQTYTTSLCNHINPIYTKLAQLDRQVQMHCLYPHPQSDVVQINIPEYDSDIDGQTDLLPDIQPSTAWHTASTADEPAHAKNIQEDTAQSLPIPKNIQSLHKLLIGLSLSPNQFQIIRIIQYTRTLNNQGKNIQPTTDPN